MPHDPSSQEPLLDYVAFEKCFKDHLLGDIKFCIDGQKYIAAAQLLMAAIDTIAGLTRPEHMEETTKAQFIEWANKYLRLEGPTYTLTGTDLYAARCGLLHGYSHSSRMVREKKAKPLGWVDKGDPPVLELAPGILVVSLTSLFVAVLQGLTDTMKRAEADEQLARLVNKRLQLMFQGHEIPLHVHQLYDRYQNPTDFGHRFYRRDRQRIVKVKRK